MSEEAIEKLTPKQKLFADYYVGDARFVGVKAAELAGYKGNYSTLAAVASENLKKPHIRAYLADLMEAITMPANVVLARLTEIANGKIDDVLDEDGKFDFETAKKKGSTHLLKKLKVKSSSKKVDAVSDDDTETLETSLLTEEVEFEMYSAHEALRDLGKYHSLFVDKIRHEGEMAIEHSGEIAFLAAAEKIYGSKPENN